MNDEIVNLHEDFEHAMQMLRQDEAFLNRIESYIKSARDDIAVTREELGDAKKRLDALENGRVELPAREDDGARFA